MSEPLREYLAPILSGRASPVESQLLTAVEAWDRAKPASVPPLENLWREWYPLRGALLPVGQGAKDNPWIIPCAALADPPSYPVFLWDFSAALDEQLDEPIVASAGEWLQASGTARASWLEQASRHLRDWQKRTDHERGKAAALSLFGSMAARFEAETDGFDHHKGGAIPRARTWRPVRVACKDILLAVCAIRFNRDRLTLDVCAWAAADHTMFARGSGTRNALELVLADAAKCGAAEGVRFLEHDRPSAGTIPPPRDVAVLARILGVTLPRSGVLAESDLKRPGRFVASASAPFPAVEIERSWVDRPARVSGIAEGELLYLVRKGVWSPEEATALTAHCPGATDTLRGRMDPQRAGMTFDVAWAHLRAARLAELAARELMSSNGPSVQAAPDEPQASEFTQEESPGSPYGRVLRYRGNGMTLSIKVLTEDETLGSCSHALRARDELLLVPVALPLWVLPVYLSSEKRRGHPNEIVAVPADVRKLPPAERSKLSKSLAPRRLMVCESDLLSIDEDILRSLTDARRLGTMAMVSSQPPNASQGSGPTSEVLVHALEAGKAEDVSVVEELTLLLERLERGLDLERSRQAIVRLLALRAERASGGKISVSPSGDVEGPRILDPAQPRRIVLGIRPWLGQSSSGAGGSS